MSAKPCDSRDTPTMRCRLRTRLRVSVLVGCGLLLAVDACCEEHELAVGDLDGRMAFGADVSVNVEFTADMEITWGTSLGFSGWAHLSGAADARVGFDPDGLGAFETTRDVDIDDDGVDESVRFVAFAAGDPDDPERVFVSWRGDKYTFDSGSCYLLWSEGNTIEMLTGSCEDGGDVAVLLSCTLGSGAQGKFGCDACGDTGACVACQRESVASCMADGSRELDVGHPEVGGSGGDAGAGGAAPVGEGGAAGVREDGGAAGAPGAGGGSDEDVALCLSLASALGSAGELCGLREAASREVLCSDHLEDVTACSAALDAVGLFEDPCGALRTSIACGSVLE